MKQNLPVTTTEIRVDPTRPLVSKTDLKGIIRYANEAFVAVSGFRREELIGKNHNLVRHPDMPPAAFQNLWDTVKQDRPWRGIVKNRSKSGDFYWVEAFVTPIFEDGRKVGYMSVRSTPSTEAVKAAETLYRAIKDGPLPGRRLPAWLRPSEAVRQKLQPLAMAVFPLLAAAGGLTQSPALAVTGAVGAGLFAAWSCLWSGRTGARLKRRAITALNAIAEGDLNRSVLAADGDLRDDLLMSIESMRIHLRAIIADVMDATRHIDSRMTELDRVSVDFNRRYDAHGAELASAGSAVDQISASVASLSDMVNAAADKAGEAEQIAFEAGDAMNASLKVSESLNGAVGEASETMEQLAASIHQIGDVTEAIKKIADQTNLLALNAAIEAARAGEAGRGFSVVADEVRTLSENTAQATVAISRIVNDVVAATRTLATDMASARQVVEEGRETVNDAHVRIGNVVDSIREISRMGATNAATLEEQNGALHVIATSMSEVRSLSGDNAVALERIHGLEQEVSAQTRELHLLVKHFKKSFE